MNEQEITLKDVAKAAGVSLATASRALRSDPSNASGTHQRVQQKAKELGYRPDPGMSRLIDRRWRGKDSKKGINLGFLYDSTNIVSAYAKTEYPKYKKRADELGYSLIAEDIADFRNIKGLLNRLDAHGVEGLIVFMLPSVSIDINPVFDKYAAISLTTSTYQPNCPIIVHDEFFCTRTAWKIIQQKGYNRIGQILPDYPESSSRNLQIGAALLCQQYTPKKNRIPIFFSNEQFSLSYDKFCTWMDRYQPEMLFGSTHLWAHQLRKQGIQLPEDIPFATGNIWDNNDCGDIAGFFRDNIDLVNRGIHLLNMMIRSGIVGAANANLTEMVQGSWVDGETLPDRHQD